MANKDKPAKQIRKKRERLLLSKDRQLKVEQELKKRKLDNPDSFQLPISKRSIQELTNYFAQVEEGTNRILPKEKRRYVIYLRKSTDDEAKQIRSLEDQRAECLELARRLDIEVDEKDILEESASAKISGNRPIFQSMIEGFKTGKYHGLISWSPDRISRNMKEAGEIIEMIDHEQIQDLQFKTYQFENSPNGKMLLGILFATSKQYSDKLAVDVSRGITGNIKDGKYTGLSKKGYYADKSTGYFVPDGFNWELLREAVNMRLHQAKTNVEIAAFLNESHLSVRKDQDNDYRLVKVDKQMVGDIFADPFYFGLYQYGKNLADLTELYDFLPLLTPDEHITLNQTMAASFNAKYVGKSKQSKRLDYGLLRGKVICDYCDSAMQFQNQEIKRGKNKGKHVVSFYCRDISCQRYKTDENKANGEPLKKSIRAKYISAHIEYVIRNCMKKSKKAYDLYIDNLRLKLAQEVAIANRKLKEAKKDLQYNENEHLRYQRFQIDHFDNYKKYYNGKLEEHQQLINVANHSIKKSEDELERLKSGLPTEQEFYELIYSYLLTLLETTDIVEQDAVYNELVSNLRAGNDSVSVIKLNPPYNLLVDLAKVSTGRTTDTAIEPTLETLYNLLLNYKLLRSKLSDLNKLVGDLIKSERATSTQFLL
jgi:DNA invertase Pin-like site-specific DNA recombinase